MTLQQKKQDLLKELAEVEAAIEASKPKPVFELNEYYYFPHIVPWVTGEFLIQPQKTIYRNNINSNYLFMFRERKRCENFNAKVLELAERQAKIEYGEVEMPGLHNSIYFDFRQALVEIREGKRYDSLVNNFKRLSAICNQCLDYIEQKELRSDNG